MIQELKARIKAIGKSDWILIVIIILVGTLAFGLGRFSVLYGSGSDFKILNPIGQKAAIIEGVSGEVLGVSNLKLQPTPSTLQPSSESYIASKTGSKYHLPWCPGALAIKEENRIYFKTKEEAEARGYAPASNCKGL